MITLLSWLLVVKLSWISCPSKLVLSGTAMFEPKFETLIYLGFDGSPVGTEGNAFGFLIISCCLLAISAFLSLLSLWLKNDLYLVSSFCSV